MDLSVARMPLMPAAGVVSPRCRTSVARGRRCPNCSDSCKHDHGVAVAATRTLLDVSTPVISQHGSSTDISRRPTAVYDAVLCSGDGSVIPLHVDRWTAAPTRAEMTVLDRAQGPVIDVGCGPARHVHELAARGVLALGIDISSAAVAVARRRGSAVLQRSVFDRLPNEGGWRTSLLLDGNVGIGGNAAALLSRLRRLMMPRGSVLVEVEAPGQHTRVEVVRVERGGAAGPWFPWARVSLDGIDDVAGHAHLTRVWTHEEEGRWFVQLRS